jgi:hypothetical protein
MSEDVIEKVALRLDRIDRQHDSETYVEKVHDVHLVLLCASWRQAFPTVSKP